MFSSVLSAHLHQLLELVFLSALFLMSSLGASAEGASCPRGPRSSLLTLLSTDFNLTTGVAEKHFSYFSEHISGITPLRPPAEVSCSFSLHHVKRDRVCVPAASNWSPDPPAASLLECVSQSELNHPRGHTDLLCVCLCVCVCVCVCPGQMVHVLEMWFV